MERRILWAFPGQGTEEAGMGVALASEYPLVRECLERASDCLGEDVYRILLRGNRRIGETQILQPAITAVSVGIGRVLEAHGVGCRWTIGHSLGEMGAVWAAGGWGWCEAIHLSAVRGSWMAEAARRAEGGMIALTDTSEEACQEAIAWGRQFGEFGLAVQNGPRLWTLTGDIEAVEAVLKRYPSRRLVASGAWHSPRMMEAVEPFRAAMAEALDKVSERGVRQEAVEPFRAAMADASNDRWKARWIANATGDICLDIAEIPRLLSMQLTHPILWMPSMQRLEKEEITDIVICGPHRVLQGLLRRHLPRVRVYATEHPRLLRETLDALSDLRSREAVG